MAETAVEVPATVTEKEAPLPPAAAEPELEPQPVVTVEVVEPEKTKLVEPTKKLAPESLVSFKEESNRLSDLSDFQRAALDELRALVRDALNNREFTHAAKAEGQPKETPPAAAQEVPAGITETTPGDPAVPQPETETLVTELEIVKELASVYETKAEEKPVVESAAAAEGSSLADEVSIWGVPLLKDDRSGVILLKFLRARDFKARDAFAMLKNTICWRREFKIDDLLGEELGDDLEKVVFMHGLDKDGHPVCYNVYGEFQNKDLYQKTFGDEERRTRFLRWRIQFLERTIRKLDFTPGGISTVFQVSDLKNSPGPGKRELRLATKQALQILQDNYPEFVAKQVYYRIPSVSFLACNCLYIGLVLLQFLLLWNLVIPSCFIEILGKKKEEKSCFIGYICEANDHVNVGIGHTTGIYGSFMQFSMHKRPVICTLRPLKCTPREKNTEQCS